ncbi:MAG: helix-turn-helix domain-containing protein [Eubacterium sp.]
MSKKYEFNRKEFKKKLFSLRTEKELSQKEMSEGIHIEYKDGEETISKSFSRTTYINWENTDNNALPGIEFLCELCNYFDVDIDYFLRKDSAIKSKDNKTISEAINMTEESIIKLKRCSNYGDVINELLKNDLLDRITNQIKKLSYNMVIDDVIHTALTDKFSTQIYNIYKQYYYNVLPIDMCIDGYEKQIKKSINFSGHFDAESFIDRNFLKDGKDFIYNNCKRNFDELSQKEKYEIIIQSIVAITYDYFNSLQFVELTKQRLTENIYQLVDTIVENKVQQIKQSMARKQ